jgi:hypothetical protein
MKINIILMLVLDLLEFNHTCNEYHNILFPILNKTSVLNRKNVSSDRRHRR